MNPSDFILPILGFLLVFNSVYFSIKHGLSAEKRNEFIIGVAVMGISIWIAVSNSATLGSLKSGNDTLSNKMESMIEKRTTDSSNNSAFQKYLKDTFGIERHGNIPIIPKPEPSVPKKPSLSMYESPYFGKREDGITLVHLPIKNFGNSVAKNVKMFTLGLFKRNGNLSFLPNPIITVGKSEADIQVNSVYMSTTTNKRRGILNEDSIFYFVKCSYSNEDNKPQLPFRDIYYIPYLTTSPIYDLDQSEYNYIKSFLIKQKKW